MKKRRLIRAGGWLTLLVLLLPLLFSCGAKREGTEIRFLDVGQGDCALIRTPKGDILIDTGPEDAEETLLLRLGDLGVTRLSLLILTHPDEDHIGGADGVLREFPVAEVWTNGEDPTEESAVVFFDTAREIGLTPTPVSFGKTAEIGGALFTVLSPALPGGGKGNEGSVVVRLSVGGVTALFTGDAEAETEAQLLSSVSADTLSSDLLKVGHHGSDTSSSEQFLAAVRPEYAVISVGLDNRFGHPHGGTIRRLEAVGATVLRTDLSGEIVFSVSDGKLIRAED